MSLERKTELFSRGQANFPDAMKEAQAILDRLKADPEKELNFQYFAPLAFGSSSKELDARNGVCLTADDFFVTPKEIMKAQALVGANLIRSLEKAAANIRKFHEAQLGHPIWMTESQPGLLTGRLRQPLKNVGVYIPGGEASYPSSALMNIIPARVAGVPEILAVTPPDEHFKARPLNVVAAHLAGATHILKLGGPWAIGALTYGSLGLPTVDKIVGPGNAFVTAAKILVSQEIGIDSPAGPSEVFIVAETGLEWANALAWDLLAQLEHDPRAAAILATPDLTLAKAVAASVKNALTDLSRAEIVKESIKNSSIIVTKDLDEAIDLANEYAPEHLQLVAPEPFNYLTRIQNAGSVFLGPNSPVAFGDYVSGPNHVLPTGGAARTYSGLSVDDFVKNITFQSLTQSALQALAPVAMNIAEAEGLTAHAAAVAQRLTPIDNLACLTAEKPIKKKGKPSQT